MLHALSERAADFAGASADCAVAAGASDAGFAQAADGRATVVATSRNLVTVRITMSS